ncbi:MAG: hypothetical protein PHN55_14835, partial [Dysgonamonadaceae bacterium]|nr:hypothetical protein [Dysgonamonadaceae bacterium]
LGKMEVVFALFFLQKYDIFNLRYENRLDSLNKTDRVYRVRSSGVRYGRHGNRKEENNCIGIR